MTVRAPWLLFAPGAGAPSSSGWMQAWAGRLGALGAVECFDYPYQIAGRRSPDRAPALIAAHRAALEAGRAKHAGPAVLAGKSMGGRMGCHLSVELSAEGGSRKLVELSAEGAAPAALVCFGYPLVGQNGDLRDAVLRELARPVLFVQGTRDPLCPLDRLAEARAAMHAPNALHVVQGGDHSLLVRKRELAAQGRTQDDVDRAILEAVRDFLRAQGLAN